PCETCVHYDVIDESGTLGCTVDVDEDDLYRERTDRRQGCPYYKFYDDTSRFADRTDGDVVQNINITRRLDS
ncbi:MAG: hypothetical protein IJY35_12420, partial [Clostridia bacterium]|nr:hypothetical protein [Clostridia bacterium]